MVKGNLVKVFFELDINGGPGSESMWAEPVKDNEFRLDNIPFFAYGVSYNDTIQVTVREDNLFFESVVRRGGHSTFRVFLKISDLETKFIEKQFQPFVDLGCSYEGNGQRLFSIDVPPTVDLKKVVDLLEEGENISKWEYEEGYVSKRVT